MTKIHKQVLEFHDTFGLPIRNIPTICSQPELMLRANLILEEVQEFVEAAGLVVCFENEKGNRFFLPKKDGALRSMPNYEDAPKPDIIEMADAIADINYVVEGAAITLGVNAEALGDEVHRSNMSKLFPDGQPHYREDGKVIKPPTYSKADIVSVLFAEPLEVA
jgi:energy-coupling factor transport system permease protein